MKAVKQTVRHYWKYQYGAWEQPHATNYTTTTPLGDLVISTTSEHSSSKCWHCMDGAKSGSSGLIGWSVNNTTSVQSVTIKFPYKIKITALSGYQNYDSTPSHANTIGRFYTSSTKETPIGDTYTNAVSKNWNKVDVTGIPSSGIITDTIFFEKTGGGSYGGLGEIDITATIETIVEGTESDYDFYTDEDVYLLPKIDDVYYGINE